MWWAFIKNSCLAVFVALSSCNQRQTLAPKIYLASSFAPLNTSIRDLIKGPVDLVFLSSSAIAQQIEQGAPCELAVFADETWPEYLAKKKLITDDVQTIATNSLVLARFEKISSQPIKQALEKLGTREKLIIGDPDYVPLGTYTRDALNSLGFYQSLMLQFMRASSARQATVMLEQKAASHAVLFRSDAQSAGFGIEAVIEARHHRPIRYPLVVCQTARTTVLSHLRRAFLSDDFKRRLKAFGFY